MTHVSDNHVQRALDVLMDPEKQAARARAAHEYLSDMTKVVKARLESQSNEKTAAAREMYALAHPDYSAHLEQVKLAAEEDFTWRDRKAASSAIIEVWRTEQSNNREAGRLK